MNINTEGVAKLEAIKYWENKLIEFYREKPVNTQKTHDAQVILDRLKGKNPYPLRKAAHWGGI